MSNPRLKFSGLATLIIDSDKFGVSVLQQMLRGLGLDAPAVIESGAAAKAQLEHHCYDLCICEAALPDIAGSELVHWIRRLKTPTRFMPILVLTGYADMGNVVALRDAGAQLVIKKPVSPQVLFDHLAWSASTSRPFIETDSYVGPDRRFKSLGPPDGTGRRDTDLSGDIGAATEPNMSQAEIDAMMRPTKVFAI